MSTFKIKFLGNYGFSIEWPDRCWLIDPIFPKDREGRNLILNTLPPCSLIIITSALYNHLDICSFNYFPSQTPVITPMGLENFLRRFIENPIIELKNENHYQKDTHKINAFELPLWGYRMFPFLPRNHQAYLLEMDGKNLFFSGSTAYTDRFIELGHRYTIDAAFIPYTDCPIHRMIKYRGLNPQDAAKVFNHLKAKNCIAIPSPKRQWDETAIQNIQQELKLAFGQNQNQQLIFPKLGEYLSYA